MKNKLFVKSKHNQDFLLDLTNNVLDLTYKFLFVQSK